jgi:hypothetical protein
MACELISGDATVGWSRCNVADIAVAWIGFGVVVTGVDSLMDLTSRISGLALLGALGQIPGNSFLTMLCGRSFLELFLGLWLIAHHKKISGRLFRAEPGAPLAEQRAALVFGIKVYALYLAATHVISFGVRAAGMIRHALRFGIEIPFWCRALSFLSCLVAIAFCLYFLKRPGWLVSFAYAEGEPDEDA